MSRVIPHSEGLGRAVGWINRSTVRTMTTLTKSLLAVCVTGLAAGSIINFGGLDVNPSWTVVLPLGAVCLGLFLISLMLEKEAAKFDVEEAKGWLLVAVVPPPQPVPRQPTKFKRRSRFSR